MRPTLIRFDDSGQFTILDEALLRLVAGGEPPNDFPLRPVTILATNGSCGGDESVMYVVVNGNCDISNSRCAVVANGACGTNGGCPNLAPFVPDQKLTIDPNDPLKDLR